MDSNGNPGAAVVDDTNVAASGSGHAPNEGAPGNALSSLVQRLAEKTPNGPIGAQAGVRALASERGCWAVDELEGGIVRVSIPRNLESFADDFQAVAGCAAIATLPNVELVTSSMDWPTAQRLSESQKGAAQYFAGIAYGMRYAVRNPAQEFSGAFGHGYAWVVHTWMETHGVQGWLVKGTSRSMAQVLTHSVWGRDVPQELRRLEALLRRAARRLPMEKLAATWCRSKNQLLGHGIRTNLPWLQVGVLQPAEASWIASSNETAAQAYKNMLHDLDSGGLSFTDLQNLPRRNAEISARLRSATLMVDNAIRGRFVALQAGKSRREIQKEQKRPILERIAHMEKNLYLEVFHPLFLRGRKFRLPEKMLHAIQDGDRDALTEAVRQSNHFCSAEQDEQLRHLAESWFITTLNGLV